MWVMTDESLLYFLIVLPVSIYSCLLILHGNSQYYLVSLRSKLVSVAAHQCAALTCRAVCRRVDIVASFKLPSVDVRLGTNETPGDAVRVRLSYSSNKREDP